MNLEDELKTVKVISFTDKIYYKGKGDVPFQRETYPRLKQDTLYIACGDKPYTEIMESVYEGLTGVKKDFFKISIKDRKRLYELYKGDKEYIKRNQYGKPNWMVE